MRDSRSQLADSLQFTQVIGFGRCEHSLRRKLPHNKRPALNRSAISDKRVFFRSSIKSEHSSQRSAKLIIPSLQPRNNSLMSGTPVSGRPPFVRDGTAQCIGHDLPDNSSVSILHITPGGESDQLFGCIVQTRSRMNEQVKYDTHIARHLTL